MPRVFRFGFLVLGVGVGVAALDTAAVEAQRLQTLTLPETAERGTVVMGSVELDAPAPAGGVRVELTSQDTRLARLPDEVIVLEGQKSAAFLVKTSPGGLELSVQIGAGSGGVGLGRVLELPPLAPVRGVAGDRWADVILGKPDFGEITPNGVTASRLFNPGGVLVDRSVRPNRLYVYDGGNSRVLGYSHLGQCEGQGGPCTTASDCGGRACEIQPGHCLSAPERRCFAGPDCADGSCVIDEGTLSADLVLGQPDASHSACNGDGNYQRFPSRATPSASSLCSMPEEQISLLEGGAFANMAVDPSGNLYVADWDNNRVLRYDSPFTTDRVADAVWGQADFSGNACNRGRGFAQPDAVSLCLRSPLNEGFTGGVAVDPSGNLWVADNQNDRVLRFPKGDGGVPAPTADLVLGQPDLSIWEGPGSEPSRMWAPQAVRVAADGTVFVVDSQPGGGSDAGGRVLVFAPPLSSGMAATGIIGGSRLRNPTGVEIDPATGHLWINDSSNHQLLLMDPARPRVLFKDVEDDEGHCGGEYLGDGPDQYDPGHDAFVDTSNVCDAYGGIGIDDDGNVFVAASAFVQDLWRFAAPFPDPSLGRSHSADKRLAIPLQFAVHNHVDAASLYSPRGVAVHESTDGRSQLIVADRGRLLFWEDLGSLTNGRPADGWVGANDAAGRPSPLLQSVPDFGRVRSDRASPSAHLWAVRGDEILAFTLPLHTGQDPVLHLRPGIPIAGGAGVVTWDDGLAIGGLAVSPDGSQLWVADPNRHRVFRIRDPLAPRPYVDVLLGQDGVENASCNRGAPTPLRNGLCYPGAVALDPSGNVYVSDAALEYVGNFRMLEWDAAVVDPPAGHSLLGPDASRAFGTGGRFDVVGCQDPMCAPWEPAFAPNGAMVVGENPYLTGLRFPLVYDSPLASPDPDTYLDDFGSQPYAAAFDSRGNLYLADLNRARVLVYWNPLNPVATAPRRPPVALPPPGDPRRVTRD